MAIRGVVMKEVTKYAAKLTKVASEEGIQAQRKQLKRLLTKAKSTEFGHKYQFSKLLKSENIEEAYRNAVPIYNYELMFSHFWHKTLSGVRDVSWPGKIENFALTSGTTGASSKRIPVSREMIKMIKKTSVKQFLGLHKLDLPAPFYEKDILFLGGSTELNKINDQFEGDLSGIITGKVPNWIAPFSKPEKEIKALKDWGAKINEIVKQAPDWDIGIVCGVPSWMQILIERINDYYGLESIHQLWPNLKIYVHGGVSFEPYMEQFNTLFSSKVVYLDTYLCSEGFYAFQPVDSDGMQLVTNSNVYFEFIPFDEHHFDSDGELINQSSLTLKEVKEGVDYALVVSTCSGAWRYLIGDTIQFVDLECQKIKITGRTKHFLSLCGEHLSVDNMTDALTRVTYEHNVYVREFAVLGSSTASDNFQHTWYLGSDQPIDNIDLFKKDLDYQLSVLNDDYSIERNFALAEINIVCLPTNVFYDFMKLKGKYGAQHKFPRVLKGKLAQDWIDYLTFLNNK